MSSENEKEPGDSSTETGLEFFTDDQIWNELQRRFDSLLLVGEKERNAMQVGYLCFWHGSAISGLGLAEYAKIRLKSHIHELEDDDTE